MGIFSKKKSIVEELPTIEIKHEHTWKDMPWYMEVEYNGNDRCAAYKIVEPYICISCGERKNVCLETEFWRNIDSETRDKYYNKIRNRYKKYLKPRAVVEDMINNILLVKDAERLNMVEKIYGIPHQNCGTSAEMKQKLDDFKIKFDEEKKND